MTKAVLVPHEQRLAGVRTDSPQVDIIGVSECFGEFLSPFEVE